MKLIIAGALLIAICQTASAENHKFSCPKIAKPDETCFFSAFSGDLTKDFTLTPAQGVQDDPSFVDGDPYIVANQRADDLDACDSIKNNGGWCLGPSSINDGVNDGTAALKPRQKRTRAKDR